MEDPPVINPKRIRMQCYHPVVEKLKPEAGTDMAGHKYVSSTEGYHLNNLDRLQERINKYHSLG